MDLPKPGVPDLYGSSDPLPSHIVATLHLHAGPRAPSETRIIKPVTVLGRGERFADVDVGDGSASRRHAFIKFKDNAFWLNDMGSTNGTVLNGELVGEGKLKDGDEIQIGTAILRFELGS